MKENGKKVKNMGKEKCSIVLGGCMKENGFKKGLNMDKGK